MQHLKTLTIEYSSASIFKCAHIFSSPTSQEVGFEYQNKRLLF